MIYLIWHAMTHLYCVILQSLLRKLENAPTADISYLSKYNSKHGIIVSFVIDKLLIFIFI